LCETAADEIEFLEKKLVSLLDEMGTEKSLLAEEILSLKKDVGAFRAGIAEAKERSIASPPRKKLPETRTGHTRRILLQYPVDVKDGPPKIEELKLYVTANTYPDTGKLGEVFLVADSGEGSTISGLMNALSICLSIGLQHGVPLEQFTSKLRNMRFEPRGAVPGLGMKRANSILDALAFYLDDRYGKKEVSNEAP
jgi:ribonucleoside-diphosphate reductase alpha chain